ncbi:hypothetical protein AFLA_009301 [Aspergillus flavus NRRL3357]|nr:hypothetical protein AFLA_009301 [Aspergillus flavus NRRL3357]
MIAERIQYRAISKSGQNHFRLQCTIQSPPEVQSKAFRQIPPTVVIYFLVIRPFIPKVTSSLGTAIPRPKPGSNHGRPTMTCLPRSAPANNLRRNQCPSYRRPCERSDTGQRPY